MQKTQAEVRTVLHTYKVRLKPTKEQIQQFLRIAGCCRFVWNMFLSIQEEIYRKSGKHLSYYDTAKLLKGLRHTDTFSFLKYAPMQVLQCTLRNLDQAYTAYFREIKRGNTTYRPPKFKKKYSNQSFVFPQGSHLTPEYIKVLFVPKLRYFTKIQLGDNETLKQVRIKSEGKHWYACITVERTITTGVIRNRNRWLGLDLGVKHFCTTSDGKHHDLNIDFAKYQEKIGRLQDKMSRMVKHSHNYTKIKHKLNAVYRKVRNIRNDFLHKLSTTLVKTHDRIAVESLRVVKMVRRGRSSRWLRKNILQQGWKIFVNMLAYKFERTTHPLHAFRGVVAVDPHHTSQRCSNCGHVDRKNRKSQSHFTCQKCGYMDNADANAAVNILAAGQAVIACKVR